MDGEAVAYSGTTVVADENKWDEGRRGLRRRLGEKGI